jgi:hypothetical protein
MSPLLIYQTVNVMHFPETDIVLMQVCTEQFPSNAYKHGFTVVILIVQYILPLITLPIVHANILLFLRWGIISRILATAQLLPSKSILMFASALKHIVIPLLADTSLTKSLQ